jgi:hypothetical protein
VTHKVVVHTDCLPDPFRVTVAARGVPPPSTTTRIRVGGKPANRPRRRRFRREAHGALGRATARLNAHGNPEPGHVGGIAHELAGRGVARLAGVLDVLPPTRLSLRAANVWASSSSSSSASAASFAEDADDGAAAGSSSAPAVGRGRPAWGDALEARSSGVVMCAVRQELWAALPLTGTRSRRVSRRSSTPPTTSTRARPTRRSASRGGRSGVGYGFS